MISRSRIAAPILLGIIMIIALACQSSGANPGGATPLAGTAGSGDTATPVATAEPTEPTLVEVLAPIQSADVNIAESFPPQYFLAVTSGLPNGCVKFGDYQVTRDGDTINVTVTNMEPEPSGLTACDMRYGLVATNIALGSDFESGKTYTVLVNDASTSFTAQVQQQGMEIEEPAPIVSVVIEKEAAKPPNSMLVIVSALPSGCHELAGHGLTRDGDTIKVEIMNMRQLGAPCTDDYRKVETSMWIDGGVVPCKVYKVIVNGEPHRVRAVDPSVTCEIQVEVPAPIDGVEVGSTRSLPPDYFLSIRSGLPNGCVMFGGYEVSTEGYEIYVTVINIQPRDSDVMCTMQYGTVDTRINLGRDFEAGVDYAVVVNGVTEATFHTPKGPAGRTGQDAEKYIEVPFEVKLHGTATIESQDLSIEFVEILEDSRCAVNVTCIWAGRAKVLIGVTLGGEALGQYELTLEGGQSDLAVARAGGYLIGFVVLNPYPGTDDPGDEPDYTVTLAVSIDKTGANDVLTDPGPLVLSLSATPVAGRLLTVHLIAELTGGPDNNRDLYCQGIDWQFGDGMGVGIMPGCIAWTPSDTIARHFEETYTYEKAGVYEVTFTYGPLDPITTKVEVR